MGWDGRGGDGRGRDGNKALPEKHFQLMATIYVNPQFIFHNSNTDCPTNKQFTQMGAFR